MRVCKGAGEEVQDLASICKSYLQVSKLQAPSINLVNRVGVYYKDKDTIIPRSKCTPEVKTTKTVTVTKY